MKPFNLEKFLAGEPAMTEHGMKVTDWHVFKNGALFVMLETGCHYYSNKGIPINWLGEGYDLFMEEKEIELWINVFKNDVGAWISYVSENDFDASLHIQMNPKFKISTHKITLKE